MEEQLPFRLILASGSTGRRYLLARAGYTFEVIPSNVDEPTGEGFLDARSLVQYVAWLKAAAVAQRIRVFGKTGDSPLSSGGQSPSLSNAPEDDLVLAADTVGWINGQVIGKPADEQDARRILRTLSGNEHELWTGVCLWRVADGLQIAWQEVSRVRMAPLSDAELDTYLRTRTWQGCSGAYAIAEQDDPYVQIIEGSLTNVIGLPMESLERVLHLITDLGCASNLNTSAPPPDAQS